MTGTKLDPYKVHRQLEDILPELAKVMAYDFERFETCRRDTLEGYARVLDRLLVILLTVPSEGQLEAIEVIKEFIASRQREPGKWKDAGWLAYMLGQVVERAKRRQRRKRHKPLADDELPF
jgi:hypothetical protein